jgi:hypothetical protein
MANRAWRRLERMLLAAVMTVAAWIAERWLLRAAERGRSG